MQGGPIKISFFYSAFICSAIFLWGQTAAPAFAQQDFFLNNDNATETPEAVATTPSEDSVFKKATPAPASTDDFFGNQVNAKNPIDSAVEKNINKDPSKDKKKISRSAEEDERAIPIKGLGLIIEADSSPQFRSVISNYYRLVREREIQPSLVYLVINGRNDREAMESSVAIANEELNRDVPEDNAIDPTITDPTLQQNAVAQKMQNLFLHDPTFRRRMASAMTIVPTYYIPSAYPVTSLPTWFLLTDKGQILLEGLEDPSGLFTKSGKFVEPIGVSEELVTPQISPAGALPTPAS